MVDGRWRIDLLGGLRAVQGDRTITRFRTQKTATLLAYLAYYRHRLHRREELVELLWPERDPSAGRDSLSTALVWLRRALQPLVAQHEGQRTGGPMGADSASSAAPCHPPSPIIVADRASVRLNPTAVTTDTSAFKAALRSAARAPSDAARAELLAQAAERYRGELLPGFQDDWVLRERRWLAELYFQALGHLLSYLHELAQFQRALEYAHRGVRADPLREEMHRELIRLYAALGQPAAARDQYHELERLLKTELGVAPSTATHRLMDEIDRLAAIPRPTQGTALPSDPLPSAAQESPGLWPPGASLPSMPPHPVSRQDGENRLVTVLFAEMSDSVPATTHLIPEEAAALMSRMLTVMVDVVLKYEGRVDRFLGEGLLALFGVPMVHEDDPERAVRAAVEIREAARHLGLEVTAGINTGAVYVGPIGSEKRVPTQWVMETTAVGPAVALASRLQGQAEPGQILVGEATYRQTRRAFEFSPLLLSAKGLAQPVTAYVIVRAMPRPEKARGIEGLRAALIGRDEELARLQAVLAKLLAGEGQIVSLTGEAGIGKSRLVAELKQQGMRDEGRGMSGTGPFSSVLWLEGRCLELSMSTGYSLFIDLFQDYFAGEEDEPARAEALVSGLRELAAEGHLSPEQVEEMGPLLGNMLSLRFGTDWDQRLKNAGPEQIRHQTLRAARDFFVALARRQPLVLLCEDLHWADSLSLDLLSLLTEALPLAPLVLLCVYRPGREHRCSHLGSIAAQKAAGCHTEIFLRELSPDQSGRLVEALLPGTPPHQRGPGSEGLPAEVKAQLLEKAHGNPFFVEELVRHLMEGGWVYRDGAVWRAREPLLSVAVPDTVQSVILSRVDRLRPDLKQLVQLASIFGRLFRRRLLEEIDASRQAPDASEGTGRQPSDVNGSGLTSLEPGVWRVAPLSLATDDWRLASALHELEEEALIYQERGAPDEEYSFQHVLTQETIYGTLLQRQRAVLHQQAAEAMEAVYRESLEEHYEQLAYHYDRSGAEEKAVEYLVKAGEKSRRAYLNESAIAHFQRALERLDAPHAQGAPEIQNPKSKMEARLAALTGLAGAYHILNRQSEAEARYREAVALGQEMGCSPEALARLYSGLCDTLWALGRRDEQRRVAQEGLRVVGKDTQSVGAALMLAWSPPSGGRLEQLLRRLPYSEGLQPAYTNAIEGMLGENRLDEAEQWLERWEREARQCHDLQAQGMTHGIRRQLLIKRGALREALAESQEGLEFVTRIGDETRRRMWLRMLSETRSLIAYHERDVEALREITAASPELFDYLIQNLSRLEELSPNAEEFRAFCDRLRRERPELGSVLAQWYLEPAEPYPCTRLMFDDWFTTGLAPDWAWLDAPGNAALSTGKGLEIEAAVFTAPRLLRWASGDFAVEAVCAPVSPEKPGVGGLLLWKDARNFLRLDRGLRGAHEIGLQRSVEDQHTIAGRGRLPSAAVHLRLERQGHDVRALCSADGRAWLRVAQVAFPVEDPVQVGLHALGTSHPSATAATRTAIRFESFRVWKLRSADEEGVP